jgi:hypothetical protein
LETTAQAIAKLDARYPWLKGAERRTVAFPADWVTYEPAERLD